MRQSAPREAQAGSSASSAPQAHHSGPSPSNRFDRSPRVRQLHDTLRTLSDSSQARTHPTFVEAPAAVQRTSRQGAVNRTGMPDQLKSGMERLSGMDLSDVRVNYNSAKPSQVSALAYAQGNQIHLGRGQERHLPHEAWHVVQQRQGRVKATGQVNGVAINDNAGLEREADLMGSRALQLRGGSDAEPRLTHNAASPVAQRALGMEFECSNLTITHAPRGAKKGTVIKGDKAKHWSMTYEDTAEGSAVVEFIIDPAAETRLQLMGAVDAIAAQAGELDKPNPVTVNGYTIQLGGALNGAIQITMGTPLALLPEMYAHYRDAQSSAPSRAFELFKKMQQPKDVEYPVPHHRSFLGINRTTYTTATEQVYDLAPDGTEVRHLPAALKGLILLLMDYIAQGFVPAAHQARAKIPFAKGLYPVMARTDFASIFKTLDTADKNRISAVNPQSGEREMKSAWLRWIVESALDDRRLSEDFLNDDRMINYQLNNDKDDPGGPRRRDFLTQLPERDLFVSGGYLGLGKLGNRTDVLSSDATQLAPVFEIRKPYGASINYRDWPKSALDSWTNYLAIVGERVNRGGLVDPTFWQRMQRRLGF